MYCKVFYADNQKKLHGKIRFSMEIELQKDN